MISNLKVGDRVKFLDGVPGVIAACWPELDKVRVTAEGRTTGWLPITDVVVLSPLDIIGEDATGPAAARGGGR